jgi:hypothetical protein
VSNANIRITKTGVEPRKRPAKFIATILPFPLFSEASSFFSPKCLISSCSAACVEAYLSWKVPFC